jgi:hypothetical protein
VDREHFIPVCRHELVDMLWSDPELTPGDPEQFRRNDPIVISTILN